LSRGVELDRDLPARFRLDDVLEDRDAAPFFDIVQSGGSTWANLMTVWALAPCALAARIAASMAAFTIPVSNFRICILPLIDRGLR
jgi:hypothetical protein